ncbi:dTDP-4-dehydrorhamnose reductase [Egicoccus sp. AB-alg6-2]|uniref:dTDP-4-dehydrorhamnose reductase n=1 Tax=Egicoccus sp. AB-alg6-2 TaxID=3242692 RepID=UPI00359E50CE
MRVLVTGAGGRLAREVVAAFEGHDVTALTREHLDISVEPAVAAAVQEFAPELVVNAAAVTDVDGCEADPDRAHRVNALGPWWLARACARTGATLVHVSTDAVFGAEVPTDGHGTPRPFTEFDPVGPVSVYGRTKAAGETLVRQTLDRHHVVRVAWVLDREGTDFVGAILRRARDRGRVEVVHRQVGSPSWVGDLGLAVREVAVSGRYGTVHRTNHGAVSRVELASAALRLAGVDAEVVRVDPGRRPDLAPRPAWSPLDDQHAVSSGLRRLPAWDEALRSAMDARGELA